MPTTDLSIEALLVRREIAEKATPGPWQQSTTGLSLIGNINGRYLSHVAEVSGIDADHIAANSPDVAIATVDELLRLRAENERLERELVRAIEVMECLLAGKPGGVYFQKYQGGLQIALRSAQRVLSGTARKAVKEALNAQN